MARIRHRRLAGNALHMLLKMTNRHVHAQVVDKEAGRVIVAAHSTEPVCQSLPCSCTFFLKKEKRCLKPKILTSVVSATLWWVY